MANRRPFPYFATILGCVAALASPRLPTGPLIIGCACRALSPARGPRLEWFERARAPLALSPSPRRDGPLAARGQGRARVPRRRERRDLGVRAPRGRRGVGRAARAADVRRRGGARGAAAHRARAARRRRGGGGGRAASRTSSRSAGGTARTPRGGRRRAWFRAWDEWSRRVRRRVRRRRLGPRGARRPRRADRVAARADARARRRLLARRRRRAARWGSRPPSYLDGASPLYSRRSTCRRSRRGTTAAARRARRGRRRRRRRPPAARPRSVRGAHAYAPILAAAGVGAFDFVSVSSTRLLARVPRAHARRHRRGRVRRRARGRLARRRVELPGGATTLRVPPSASSSASRRLGRQRPGSPSTPRRCATCRAARCAASCSG